MKAPKYLQDRFHSGSSASKTGNMISVNRRKILIVNLLFCCALVYTFVLIKDDIFDYDFVPLFANWSDDASGAKALEDYAGIVEGNLYGTPGKLVGIAPGDRVKNRPVVAKRPVIDRSISLMGTIVPGYAVFEDKLKKKQELFKNGDEVFSKGHLVSVEERQAQILKNGTLYTYNLIVTEKDGRPAPASGNRLVAKPRSVNKQAPPVVSSREPDKTRWSFTRSKVNSIVNDIGTVLYDAKLTLNEAKDSRGASGYKVSEVTKKGIFNQGGVKDGDVILRVNGFDVTSKLNWGKLFTQLKSQTRFNVDILRNGEPVRLQYRIQ